jgi:FemAB-related protein (PEP-CTERM system-associated)
MSLQLRPVSDADGAAWDAFVERTPEATFFHRWGWRQVIGQAFGHERHYQLAERDGEVVGILPLVRVRSHLFGDNLVSMPFGVYGGPVATDEMTRHRLQQAACELADALGVGSLELRHRQPYNPDWPTKPLYYTFRKTISADHEANLKAIPRKQRAMVRKGIKADLQGEQEAGVDRLYAVYSESVRNLGTPVFPKRYFQLLRNVFGDACDVSVIRHAGEDVAAVMSFWFRDEVLPFYGGSRPAARQVAGNDFMYWDLMCRAADRGISLFDYGRSKQGSGAFSFKKNWGFEPEPLFYEYHLVRDSQMPEVNPANPKYRLFIDAWKRLPLPLANLIGPRLSPYLG